MLKRGHDAWRDRGSKINTNPSDMTNCVLQTDIQKICSARKIMVMRAPCGTSTGLTSVILTQLSNLIKCACSR